MKKYRTAMAMAALAAAGEMIMPVSVAKAEAGPLLGAQAVGQPLPWFDAEPRHAAYTPDTRELHPNSSAAVTSIGRPPMPSPVTLRLSRFRYPAEDRHLDAIVRFDLDPGQTVDGALDLELTDAAGRIRARGRIDPIPGTQLHFSFRFPAELSGDTATLDLAWERNGQSDRVSAPFEVSPPAGVAREGRIRLQVPNGSGATLTSAPMTVGVPFPRGALDSVAHLRLVDGQGNEIPLQARETARWSRFGSVKWVLCDFTLDLAGEAREVFLEYGPDVRRIQREDVAVKTGADGFPTVDAGRVRLHAEGLLFDPSGEGAHRTVLAGGALAGAFVEQALGANYTDWGHRHMSSRGRFHTMADAAFEIEEQGPEKVVLRTEGWYIEPESGERFCRYVVRYTIHRDSPLVRIFHTWIFTGDGNRDAIRTMGWQFPLGEGMTPSGFLSSLDDEAAWLSGYYLRQHDADSFAVFDHDEPQRGRRVVDSDPIPARPIAETGTGGRAPGIMGAEGQGVRVSLGVQDFWQNFPGSLMAEEDALTFHQWPRYGRPRQHPVHGGDMGNVWRLWFAHEGETLNFRVPQEIVENPIYVTESGPEPHMAHGRPDSINAQGVAKTAEMWVLLSPAEGALAEDVRVLRGLRDETLRAVVDPRWMAASGAFYEIAAEDRDAWPEAERVYAESVRSPLRQVERMGIYGKWIYGDVLRSADLDGREAGLYRTFRKAHWGWPFSWIPFVRSGEPELLRFAQAATRMMSDVAFCHYVSGDLARYFEEEVAPRRMWITQQPYRAIGWHNRNLIPWAGYWGTSTRMYVDKAEYLWDAWFVTGYHRARDVALAWAEQTKIEEPERIMRGPITAAQNRARWPANLQRQYLEMYEATWDPWFLAAAQGLADMHVWRFRTQDWAGHFWHAGYVAWQRYSGCPEHGAFLQRNIELWCDMHQQGWASTPTTIIPAAVFGHGWTSDPMLLRRAAGVADLSRWAVYGGETPDYYRGIYVRGRSSEQMLFTSWMQTWFPLVLGAFERAGGMPANPIPFSFDQAVTPGARVAVRKEAGQSLELRIGGACTITAPDGSVYLEADGDTAVIAEEALPGVYRLAFPRRRRSVRLPLSPLDTPEVFMPGPGETVGAGQDFAQYWFRVPEGTGSFFIEFQNTEFFRQDLRQVMVWTPDGGEAWAHRERAVDHDPQREIVRAEIRVPTGHAGRLWRITQPGQRSMPFRLDPALPGVFAHDPARWFDPDAP